MIQKLPKSFLYFLSAIFFINLLQSHFTQLIFDEAYYWYYAQNMAWGYFDHPPMVALLVKISSFFFSGELGVRFMSCILSAGTIVILWFLIDNDKKKEYVPHFFALVFSMTLLNAYGFFTLPDTPLLFFTALFLWIYKKFIAAPSIILSFALGVTMAALMYSKYHAVLVIVFVLLSNIKLITNKYAWFAVIIALVCFTPHFIWLFENDFISIKYHLSERPNQAYSFEKFTLGFLLNLIAIFGFTFPLVYYALFKTKNTDKLTNALLYLTYGVLIFFFVSSFSKRVQTQWIIIICIPMVVLVANYMFKNETHRKWLYRLAIINIAIILFLRIGLAYEPLSPILYETHQNKKWVNAIASEVGDTPVVFENSYRNSPMYAFYSGKTSYSLNNIHYRQNQYTIDSSQYKVQHKKILYVSNYLSKWDFNFDSKGDEKKKAVYIDNFESFRSLKCLVEDDEIFSLKEQKEYTLKVYNPYNEAIDLNKIKFGIAYCDPYKRVKEVHSLVPKKQHKHTKTLKAKDTTLFTFKLVPSTKLEDPSYFKISISENNLPFGLNSKTIKLEK